MPATDLFLLKQISHGDGVIRAQLGINADSEILKGHFPGHPVVPGASMLQLVKDVLEEVLNTQLQLKKADHLKFMSLIEPQKHSEAQLEINYRNEGNEVSLTAKLSAAEVTCFKFQGSFNCHR